MNIAIMGYGTVGKGVDLILQNHPTIHVTKILEKEERIDNDNRKTALIDDILNDDTIELVVETMGGIDIAFEYISKAMRFKKHVVTANKAVVANKFAELHHLASECGVMFTYEASVGGVLPIIHIIKAMNRFEDISTVGGILNGTSNFILDNMTKNNLPFSLALHDAQLAGYAEADPSADIDGIDVKNKIMILSSLAFKQVCDYSKIKVSGIRNISKDDIEYFSKQGLVCKLFALATRENNTYTSIVEPVLFPLNSVFAQVSSNNNAAFVYSNSSGQIIVHGQGAGQLPTGHAVVEDIVDIYENKSNEFINVNKLTYVNNENKETYYIRSNANINYGTKISENMYKVETTSSDMWNKIKKEIEIQDDKAFIARYDKESINLLKWDEVKG